MSPGLISRVVVADKIAAIRRMLDGIHSLPLDDLATFTADPRMVAAGDSYLRRALEALLDLARHVLSKGLGAPRLSMPRSHANWAKSASSMPRGQRR